MHHAKCDDALPTKPITTLHEKYVWITYDLTKRESARSSNVDKFKLRVEKTHGMKCTQKEVRRDIYESGDGLVTVVLLHLLTIGRAKIHRTSKGASVGSSKIQS